MAAHPPDLAGLLAGLDPQASLADRHLWLMRWVVWVRGDGRDVRACTARVQLFLDVVQSRPDWQALWRQWWAVSTQAVDLAPLLADHGFAPRTAFVSELGERLRRRLLPGTPETTEAGALFDLVFDQAIDARWIRALDPALLARAHTLLFADPADGASDWHQVVQDAVVYATSQVGATGFAAEIRVRMSAEALRERSFHALAGALEAWRRACAERGPRDPDTLRTALALRECLDSCRNAAYTVYAHLDEHGISVGIVFRLRQLRERVLRIKALLDVLQADPPDRSVAQLVADLVQVGRDNRSVRALIASSSHLTAAKVAERSAESGEHYITRNMAEYRAMLWRSAGGGAVIGFTTWAKFVLGALTLSAFWAGLAAGLNYALSFVLVQLLHFTVATKQPAVTAPAMVAKLRDIRRPRAVRSFVDEVAHLFRSQVAAILGNIGLVVPTVALISSLLAVGVGQPMIGADKARYVLHSLDVTGPTALYAVLTGGLLFASSIVAGWVENWFVLHRLDSAMAHNPRFTGVLGTARAARWARFTRQNVSGLAANTSLGLMLGLVPAFAGFFGLGVDVRHVTLSAGQLTAAAMALGPGVVTDPAFWLAVAGVLVVGPINLGVSFYLAFRLALKAQNVSAVNRDRIRVGLRRRLRNDPLSFLRPKPTPHG